MKKIIFVFLFILLFYSKNYGQLVDSFEKANIELFNGEKYEGLVKIGDKYDMAKQIIFKRTGSVSEVFYTPTEIKKLTLNNGEIYVALNIKVNKNKTELVLFGKQLIDGLASLYQGEYEADDIFIISNNGINYVLQNDKIRQTELVKFNYEGYLKLALEDIFNTQKKINFNEKEFVKLVLEYNKSKGTDSKVVEYKSKPIHYYLGFLGMGIPNRMGDSELFVQSMYRTYFPNFSKSTSLNIGLSYYNYKYSEEFSNIYGNKFMVDYKTNLISLPIQIQQNILNKKIRPFFYLGINLSYIKSEDQYGNSQVGNGLQNNFGVGLLYGAGLEFDVYKKLLIKSELRSEIFGHLLLVGIGYNF
jgi:hypothetical protein